jgi:hypothetical protein
MWALLSWRVWAGAIVAIALAASHWKVYVSGKNTVRAEFNAYIAEEKMLLSAAAETARIRERSINTTLRQSYDQYNTLKGIRAADVKSSAGRLRELEATIASNRSTDTPSNGGANDTSTYKDLFISCSRSLQSMAEEADGVSGRLSGLQDYVKAIKP